MQENQINLTLPQNHNEKTSSTIIKGNRAKSDARWMDIAIIIAAIFPFPLIILLFGMAILIYAFTRFHPNPKVGYYIQKATYRFYGTTCILIPIGTFFPAQYQYWLLMWAIGALILIPSSIMNLIHIQKDLWLDVNTKSTSNGVSV